jgi:hypothetical protein
MTKTLRPVNILSRDPEDPTNEILFRILYALTEREEYDSLTMREAFSCALFVFDSRVAVLTVELDEQMNPVPANSDTIRIYNNVSDAMDYIQRMTKALSE